MAEQPKPHDNLQGALIGGLLLDGCGIACMLIDVQDSDDQQLLTILGLLLLLLGGVVTSVATVGLGVFYGMRADRREREWKP